MPYPYTGGLGWELGTRSDAGCFGYVLCSRVTGKSYSVSALLLERYEGGGDLPAAAGWGGVAGLLLLALFFPNSPEETYQATQKLVNVRSYQHKRYFWKDKGVEKMILVFNHHHRQTRFKHSGDFFSGGNSYLAKCKCEGTFQSWKITWSFSIFLCFVWTEEVHLVNWIG